MSAHTLAHSRSTQLVLSASFLAVFGAMASVAAQMGQPLEISVNDPRPLARAAQMFEKRHGWVITYEETSFVHEGDIEDVTLATRMSRGDSKSPRTLIPRGGPFVFSYRTPAGASVPEEGVLEMLLEQFHLSGYPGQFRLIKGDNVFHIVPAARKDPSGAMATAVSLLDVRVSVPDEERSAFGMLEAITTALSRAGAARVTVGTVPVNVLMRTRVRGGARNETARGTLLRTLQTTGRQMSWRLLCEPGPAALCALNVHDVPRPSGQAQQ
jgi:hypothetical protein